MFQVGQPPCLTGSSKRKSRKDDSDDEGKDRLLATVSQEYGPLHALASFSVGNGDAPGMFPV